jgi:hypothetical protein
VQANRLAKAAPHSGSPRELWHGLLLVEHGGEKVVLVPLRAGAAVAGDFQARELAAAAL